MPRRHRATDRRCNAHSGGRVLTLRSGHLQAVPVQRAMLAMQARYRPAGRGGALVREVPACHIPGRDRGARVRAVRPTHLEYRRVDLMCDLLRGVRALTLTLSLTLLA